MFSKYVTLGKISKSFKKTAVTKLHQTNKMIRSFKIVRLTKETVLMYMKSCHGTMLTKTNSMYIPK